MHPTSSSATSSSATDPYAAALGPVVATDLVKSYSGAYGVQRVLDGVSLTAAPGSRVGLIGENGSGKTTLLRILAGATSPDSGAVSAPVDLMYLPQEPELAPGGTVGDLLESALRPLRDAVLELERLAAAMSEGTDVSERYDRVLAWATHHDAWDAERRAEVTAAALGVGELDPARALASVSGGERSRLALAAALVRRPAVLLLDEPTNHLDDVALELLEQSLVTFTGVVLATSHDRTFLDNVCTELFDLDAGALGSDGSGGRRFSGTFSDYLGHRAASRRRWEETFAAQQEEIARLREQTRLGTEAVAHNRGPRDNDKFIHQFKGGNVERAQARRVHDAQRRLAVAERDQLRKPPRPLTFAGRLARGEGDGVVVAVRELLVDGRVAVPLLDVARGERLLVTGANGSGKSTLLSVLTGDLAPDQGTVSVTARRTRLVAQDPVFADAGLTAAATYVAALGVEVAERVPLGALGLLRRRDQGKQIGELSIGQRRRLALAIAIGSGPDLLLLDEPTNHLSLTLAGEIEEALQAPGGTVVVTSHDRWLRQRWRGRTYELSGAAPRRR